MNKPSPIVLSLLLAATLCVDAVAGYWWGLAAGGETAFALYIGLMFGTLSVLCVWAANCRRGSRIAWMVPFVAGVLMAPLTVGLPRSFSLKPAFVLAFTGLFWIHVAALLALLWVWKQTRFARSIGQSPAALPWQVSIMQLLVVTAVAAVILTVWTNSLLRSHRDISWIPWVIDNITLAFVAVVIISRPWLLITRTAALAAAALGCGALFFLVLQSMDQVLGGTGFPFWQNLFHASVLLIWLQLGGITATAAPPATSTDE